MAISCDESLISCYLPEPEEGSEHQIFVRTT